MAGLALIAWFLTVQLLPVMPFLVDGPSMEPTLGDGALFIMDKSVYNMQEPRRGDIVVFILEDEPDYFYVKRVIGLPGERIAIKRDGIYLVEDGVMAQLHEPYLTPIAPAEKEVYTYKLRFTQYYSVPNDQYFVLGDNRLHSLDSRYFKQPFISKAQIKGKYIFTLFDTI